MGRFLTILFAPTTWRCCVHDCSSESAQGSAHNRIRSLHCHPEKMQALPLFVNPSKFFNFLRVHGFRFDKYHGNAWKLFSAFFGKYLLNDPVITTMLTSPQHFCGSLDDLACRLRANLRVACDDRYLATHGACITESNYHAIADAVLRIFASIVARKARHAPPPMKSRRRRRLPFALLCRTKPSVVA